jgi:hypothetical protein
MFLRLVGHLLWHHINPGTSGPEGVYDLCSRCGREKKSYRERGKPSFGGSLPGGPPHL